MVEEFSILNINLDDNDVNYTRRTQCERCKRPIRGCLCDYLPLDRLQVLSKVIILQHPNEVKRAIRTVPILCECLTEDSVQVYTGRRFHRKKYTELHSLCDSGRCILLYPGDTAVDLSQWISGTEPTRTLPVYVIALDGTWPEARSLYTNNAALLSKCARVSIRRQSSRAKGDEVSGRSEFVIRKQPNASALSTLESVAQALSMLEGDPTIAATLHAPLRRLCQIQLDHGEVIHDAKVGAVT